MIEPNVTILFAAVKSSCLVPSSLSGRCNQGATRLSMDPSREVQLRKLKSLIRSSEAQLTAVLEKLKWSKDEVLKKKGYVVCPLDSGHTMPEASLSAHLDLCAWLKEGYSRQDKEAAPPSSHFFYTKSTSVVPVLIDRETQNKIITDAAFRGDVPAHLASAAATIMMLFVARLVRSLPEGEEWCATDNGALLFGAHCCREVCSLRLCG